MAAARVSPTPVGFRRETKRLRKHIGAMSIAAEENGHTKLGIFTSLMPGSEVEVRGAGFTPNTVRVRVQGTDYYVMRSSLMAQ